MLLNNSRIDGRQFTEIRNIAIDHQYIENKLRVNLRQGLTEVNIFLEPSVNRKINFSSTNIYEPERAYNFFLYRSIEIFQFNFLDNCKMHIEIIRDSGSLFSTIVNGISITAIVGGIQMQDVFIGSTIGYFKKTILYDSSDYEQQSKIMKIDSVFSANSLENYYFYFKGDLSLDEVERIFNFSKNCTSLINEQIEKYLNNLI